MDGPRDYHTKSEINQRQISHITNITYMWNLKKLIQWKLIYKTETHSQT